MKRKVSLRVVDTFLCFGTFASQIEIHMRERELENERKRQNQNQIDGLGEFPKKKE